VPAHWVEYAEQLGEIRFLASKKIAVKQLPPLASLSAAPIDTTLQFEESGDPD